MLHDIVEHLERLKNKLFDFFGPNDFKALLEDLYEIGWCRGIQVAIPVIFFNLPHLFFLSEDVNNHRHNLAVRFFSVSSTELEVAMFY